MDIQKVRENIKERLNIKDIDDINNFISQAKRYIDAIKKGKMVCAIDSVSKSGMTRTIKFLSCEYNSARKQYQYFNYYYFFKKLGYSQVKDSDYFRIQGCGMDMIFNTNYNNIHDLYNLGFITKKQCQELAQKTPIVI